MADGEFQGDTDLRPGDELEFIVPEEDVGERLDRWLARRLGEASSRAQLQKWLAGGAVRRESISGEIQAVVRSAYKVRAGEIYRIIVPRPPRPDLRPIDQHLRVVFDDEDLALIVKPPGLAVHPGPGDEGVSLVNGLLYAFRSLAPGEDDTRPGIVHRLDKPTEGLLLVAKNDFARRKLMESFARRQVYKEYLAWLAAAPPTPRGRVELPLERHPAERLRMRVAAPGRGREAITEYVVEKTIVTRKGRKFARAVVIIKTGRTHQIRAHLAHLGCPVVGDELYSRGAARYEKYGLLLLARRLRFRHPRSGEELEFELEEPERFLEFERKCPGL